MQDLDAIVAGEEPVTEPAVEEVAVEPVAEPTTPEEPVAAAPEEPKQAEQTVPLSALLEVRRELQDVKAMLPQKEAPPPPDVIDDQQGFVGHLTSQVSQAITGMKLEQSRFSAEREHGKEVVEAARQYFDAHPEQSTQLMNHPSPFHAAVEHYQAQQVAQEIGNDPAAYAAKIEAEVRAKVEAELVAKQARDVAGKFAPSMADVTGTGGGAKTSWAGPTSLSQAIGE